MLGTLISHLEIPIRRQIQGFESGIAFDDLVKWCAIRLYLKEIYFQTEGRKRFDLR